MVGLKDTITAVADFFKGREEEVEVYCPVSGDKVFVTVGMIVLDMYGKRRDAAFLYDVGRVAAAPGVPDVETPAEVRASD